MVLLWYFEANFNGQIDALPDAKQSSTTAPQWEGATFHVSPPTSVPNTYVSK